MAATSAARMPRMRGECLHGPGQCGRELLRDDEPLRCLVFRLLGRLRVCERTGVWVRQHVFQAEIG